MSQPERSLELHVEALEIGYSTFEPWTLCQMALNLGDMGQVEAALESGLLAAASACDRGIEVESLTQFGEPLPEALRRWRAELDPVAVAVARAEADGWCEDSGESG